MRDKIALEEHLATEAMSALWDDAGEASRNGKDYMDWVEERLLDLPEPLQDMDELSGLFDRFLTVQVILGHLGEGLPFTLPRLEHRL